MKTPGPHCGLKKKQNGTAKKSKKGFFGFGGLVISINFQCHVNQQKGKLSDPKEINQEKRPERATHRGEPDPRGGSNFAEFLSTRLTGAKPANHLE